MHLGRGAGLVGASSQFYLFASLGTFYNLKNGQLDHPSASCLGTGCLAATPGINWALTSDKLCVNHFHMHNLELASELPNESV